MPNNYKVLPLFSSAGSIGNSILTLEEPPKKENYTKDSPQSIIQICLDNDIKDLFLVENSFNGFAKGLNNCAKFGINFHFGLKITVCENNEIKTNESLETNHKVIIFANEDGGYKKLLDIYSNAAVEGFYYEPRTDYSKIKLNWDDSLTTLLHPFYGSFLHRNTLYGSSCNFNISDFPNCFFLKEQNDLPFNFLIENVIENFRKDKEIQIINSQSIYYLDESYFESLLVHKCIVDKGHFRKTLDKPNIQDFSSSQFNFENWKYLNSL